MVGEFLTAFWFLLFEPKNKLCYSLKDALAPTAGGHFLDW